MNEDEVKEHPTMAELNKIIGKTFKEKPRTMAVPGYLVTALMIIIPNKTSVESIIISLLKAEGVVTVKEVQTEFLDHNIEVELEWK